MKNINIATPSYSIESPTILPFDIRKAIYDASKIDGIIYIGISLFDQVYKYCNENIDKPFDIDTCGFTGGKIKIVATDLLPENGFRVMTKMEFLNEFENGK